jgi:hypothetical protein
VLFNNLLPTSRSIAYDKPNHFKSLLLSAESLHRPV